MDTDSQISPVVFSTDDTDLIDSKTVIKILNITPKQLSHWRERKQFPADKKEKGVCYYSRRRVEEMKAALKTTDKIGDAIKFLTENKDRNEGVNIKLNFDDTIAAENITQNDGSSTANSDSVKDTDEGKSPQIDSVETSTALATVEPATTDAANNTTLEKLTEEISMYLSQAKWHAKQTSECMIKAGERLILAKEKLPHGEWQNWLAENFNLTVRTAQCVMKVAERFGKNENVFVFQPSNLIAMLALTAGDENEFVEEMKAAGTPIETLSVRALKAAIKKRVSSKTKTDSADVPTEDKAAVPLNDDVSAQIDENATASTSTTDTDNVVIEIIDEGATITTDNKGVVASTPLEVPVHLRNLYQCAKNFLVNVRNLTNCDEETFFEILRLLYQNESVNDLDVNLSTLDSTLKVVAKRFDAAFTAINDSR